MKEKLGITKRFWTRLRTDADALVRFEVRDTRDELLGVRDRNVARDSPTVDNSSSGLTFKAVSITTAMQTEAISEMTERFRNEWN